VKLERERTLLAETLKAREAALKTELDQKLREWKGVNDALQEQLSRETGESAKIREAQQARLAELDRQNQEAQSQAKILQHQLQGV